MGWDSGTITENEKVIVSEEKYDGCAAVYNKQTVGTRTIGSINYQSLTPESRQRPESLRCNFTARAWQFTGFQDYQKYVTTSKVSKTCSDGSKATGTRRSYGWKQPLTGDFNPAAMVCSDNWVGPLRAKILDDMVNFAETIGEYKDLLDMLKGGATILTKVWRHMKALLRTRGNRRRLKRWFRRTFGRDPRSRFEFKDVVATDLMIKFGISPTLGLIQDTLDKLAKVSQAKRKIQVTLKNREHLVIPGPYGGRASGYKEVSCRAIACVTYKVGSDFTAGNLGSMLWAGIPFSFVVDWFINISQYLASFDVEPNLTSFTCCLATKKTGECVDTRKASTSAQVLEPGKYKIKGTQRGLISTLPYSNLPTFRLPEYDFAGRLATLTELLYMMRR